jgi:hypothetical protein
MLAEQKAGCSAAVIGALSAGHPWPAGDPLTQTPTSTTSTGASSRAASLRQRATPKPSAEDRPGPFPGKWEDRAADSTLQAGGDGSNPCGSIPKGPKSPVFLRGFLVAELSVSHRPLGHSLLQFDGASGQPANIGTDRVARRAAARLTRLVRVLDRERLAGWVIRSE